MDFYQRPNSYDISYGLLLEMIGCEDGYLYYSREGKLVVEKIQRLDGQLLVLESGKKIDPRKLDATTQKKLRSHFKGYHLRVEKANYFEKYGARIEQKGKIFHLDVVSLDFDNSKMQVSFNGKTKWVDLDSFDLNQQRDLYIKDKKQGFLDSAADGLLLVQKLLKNPFDPLIKEAVRSDFAKFDFDEEFMDLVVKDPQLMHLEKFMIEFRELLMEDVLSVTKLIRLAGRLLAKKSLFKGLDIYDKMIGFIETVVPRLDLIVAEAKIRNLPRGVSASNMYRFFTVWLQSSRGLKGKDREALNDMASEVLKSILEGFSANGLVLGKEIDVVLGGLEYLQKIMGTRFKNYISQSDTVKHAVGAAVEYLNVRKVLIISYNGKKDLLRDKSNDDIREIIDVAALFGGVDAA